MDKDCSSLYKDIINLPHHQSKTRKHMSMVDRAAQFSPFAALTGHSATIAETARLTDRQIELTEGDKAIINEKLQMLSDYLKSEPVVTITYFEPDDKKSGGSYETITGTIKRIDEVNKEIKFIDGSVILIERIYDIEGELFEGIEC